MATTTSSYRIENISPIAHRKRGTVQTWAVVNKDDDSECGVVSTHTTREEARAAIRRYNRPVTDR